MEPLDLVIEAAATHLDWCTDPSDLDARSQSRLRELEPRDDVSVPAQEKLADEAREKARTRHPALIRRFDARLSGVGRSAVDRP
jgi:hypothetical protein